MKHRIFYFTALIVSAFTRIRDVCNRNYRYNYDSGRADDFDQQLNLITYQE